MISTKRQTDVSFREFVVIVSLMMSLTALSIDAMLPALPQIGRELQVASVNDRQLVVSVVFLGLAAGQLFFGPLSDHVGRKPAMYLGYGLYIVGALVAATAVAFPIMVFGRLLQGFGVSAPRAVTLALVRDRYEGRTMARLMSFVMAVFILVPMIAPSFGQAILLFSGWRAIFGGFVLMAAITVTWFALRMPETLAPEHRAPFTLPRILKAAREIARMRPAIGYTIVAGFVSGAHLGYLSSSQQLLQEQYGLGALFPLYFALVALAIGVASVLNARLVLRFGMRALVRRSMLFVLALSTVALALALAAAGQPPLWLLLAYLMTTFFCIGIQYGNNNALAMQPLGHIAGIGAAVVGSLSTLIAFPLGTLIGRSYNGTALPLIAGIAIIAGLSLLVIRWIESE